MNKIKQTPVSRVDQNSFRKHLKASVAAQILGIALILFVSKLEIFSSENSWIPVVLLLGVCIIWNHHFFKLEFFQGRFKDIYPEHDLSVQTFIISLMSPLNFFLLTLFLTTKKSGTGLEKPSKIFKHYVSLPLTLFLIVLQFALPPLASTTGSPSTLYMVKTMTDATKIIAFRKTAKTDSIIEDYQSLHGTKLTSTGLILLTAVYASNLVKEKSRTVASQELKAETDFRYAFQLLNHTDKTLHLGKKSNLEFTDFGPLQWLSPSGPVEILLLSFVEVSIFQKLSEALLGKSQEIIENLKKQISKLPVEKQPEHEKKLKEIESRLLSFKSPQAVSAL